MQEALKLIHGLPVEAGQAMVWNGQANNFYKTAYQRKDDCLSHDTYPEPIELPLSAAATADELFAAAAPHFGTLTRSVSEGMPPQLTLSLDRDLVVSLDCPCGASRIIMQPQQLVGASQAKCPACGQLAKPRLEHSIDAGTPLAKEKLSALGIPPYDIVPVADAASEQVFLLVGDQELVMSQTD